MSKIIACYKWVADEADIKINPDLSVDLSKAKGKISDYDKNAIEAAVQTAASLGEKAVSLTFGNASAKQSLKDALSRGLEEGYWINAEEAAKADGAVTAKALAAAIDKISDYSLVICAEGASDTYARQTAPRIGAALHLPVITSVVQMSFNGSTLIAVRKLEDNMETVQVELPAVIAVLPEINEPPIPGLKAVMAAGKKPVTEFKATDLGIDFTPKNQVTTVKGYVMNRKNIIFREGSAADQVKALAAALRKECVL
jgi:electron transfer flavoprotein beta subunit